MGESAVSMFRRGMISPKQADKLGILKQTKTQNSRMADFDGRGSVDEGGRKDKGAGEASSRHIDKRQDKGTPARASGKPSAGGSAGAESQPVRRGHLDAASLQKPDMARGAGITSAKAKAPAFSKAPTPGGGKPVPTKGGKMGTPKRLKGPIAKQGGQYGGGGRDTQ